MERFSFIFLVAGLGFFALAFAVSGYVPMIQFDDLPVLSVEELAKNPPLEFVELREDYPEAFDKAFAAHLNADGSMDMPAAFADALRTGRKIYVGEACWHCHSQQVRPVGNDEARFGRISYPEEYNNEMNFPVLWGTRRIGPDLIRQSGVHSNDWHVAHFWNPPDVSPTSVMPRYPWFYEIDGLTPNRRGLAIIAYVQWLGSWLPNHRETAYGIDSIEREYVAPAMPQSKPAGDNTTPDAAPQQPDQAQPQAVEEEEPY